MKIVDSSIFGGVWCVFLTLAFLHNILSICMVVFSEFSEKFYTQWILMNCFTDAINVLDLFVKIKKGFTIDGSMGNNRYISIRKYIFCRAFLLDLLAILPTDILLLIWPNFFLLRINRLAKIGRVSEIVKLIEHRIPWPLGFRLLRLATFCYLLFHWNACFYFYLSSIYGFENSTVNDWTFSYQKIPDLLFPLCEPRFDFNRNECLFPEENWRDRPEKINELKDYWQKKIGSTNFNNLTKKYAMSFYWSALTLVTLGEQPWPANSVQTAFEIIDTLIGLLLFAAIIGDIGIMVSNAHLEKVKFQEITDGCKRYMRIRNVNTQLYNRVINWIEYQWIWGRRLNEDEKNLFQILPPRLGLELAAESHVRALIGSPVFSLCERALLSELAIRLQTLRLCPGDIVCRKGETPKVGLFLLNLKIKNKYKILFKL
uniref:Ion transport domain-containing protein n=1 Tax=Meloidogyne enterolobii TaxID=390850 RepID=A0A6V7UTY0_MELEN|nr:unnamed protein product [Meloidogyne enterolobii]